MFYLIAVLNDFGVGKLAIMRFLPGILMTLSVVPFYLLASVLLNSKYQVGLATLLYSLASHSFVTYLGASGMVRSGALFFFLSGVYGSWQLFANKNSRWLIPSGILFGLVMLSHPSITVRLVLSYILMYLVFNRTSKGILSGTLVALIGLLISAPWFLTVLSIHGTDPYIAAFRTFQSFSSRSSPVEFVYNIALYQAGLGQPTTTAPSGQIVWYVTLLGSVYLVSKKKFFLPLWFVVTGVLGAAVNMALYAQSMIAAAFFINGFSSTSDIISSKEITFESVVIGLFLLSIVTSTFFFSLNTAVDMTETLSDDKVEGMEWVANNTDETDTFVVTGGVEEWFPLFTHRTILVARWGAEWKGPDEYHSHNQMRISLRRCDESDCVTTLLNRNDLEPDYLVTGDSPLRQSLNNSSMYSIQYSNSDLAVFEVDINSRSS
jgi:hypothetical protein